MGVNGPTETCFYCGALVSATHVEYDHMPIPQSFGGTEVVPACLSCHDMKDRFPGGKWPEEWTRKTLEDWPLFSRETRLWLAKQMRLMAEAIKLLEQGKP